MTAPCYNCHRRTVGCHGQCGEYKAYDAERKLENERRAAQNERERDMVSYEIGMKIKCACSRGRKLGMESWRC